MVFSIDLRKYKLLIGQLFRFGVVGCISVAFDALLYYVFLKAGLPVSVSKGLSAIICIICAYFMHSCWTFQSKRTTKNMFVFCIVYGISIIQNVLTNSFLVNSIKNQYRYIIAFLVATSISVCINFFAMKFFVFSERMNNSNA